MGGRGGGGKHIEKMILKVSSKFKPSFTIKVHCLTSVTFETYMPLKLEKMLG